MTFDLSEYATVAERIAIFKLKYPEGSLQSEVEFVNGGVLCVASAYRTPEDPAPGMGHAYEPIPGKTPYTKDSEVMNAETSAWGRAIVALGFETKKIASAEEIRARDSGAGQGGSSVTAPAPDDTEYLAATARAQEKGARPSDQVLHWSKHKGKRLDELTPASLKWYAEEWKLQDDPSPYDVRLKSAAQALLAGNDHPDWDIPFE